MKSFDVAIAAQLAERTGLKVRLLFWIKAKNRSTGALETIGIWNGDDVRAFTVDGVSRTYYGAPNLINVDSLRQEQGLIVRRLKANISTITPEIELAVRQYQPRMAPVEWHWVFFNPLTDIMIGNPTRFFKGWIDTISLPRPAKNETTSGVINMVGNSRLLTITKGVKRSHASQQERLSTDRFFEYVSVSGSGIITPWGSK